MTYYISVTAGGRFEDAGLHKEGNPPDPMTGYSGHRMSPWWWPESTHVYLAEGIRKAVRKAGTPIVMASKREMSHTGLEPGLKRKAQNIGCWESEFLIIYPEFFLDRKFGIDI